MNTEIFNTMFIIIPIFSILLMIMVFVLLLSPKARGKFMSKQIKAQKEMLKYSKDDLKEFSNYAINTSKEIMEDNEDALKELSDMKSNIDKNYYKNIASAVKEGLTEDNIYCKHCGKTIDNDSKFCKYCGKEQ